MIKLQIIVLFMNNIHYSILDILTVVFSYTRAVEYPPIFNGSYSTLY